MLSATILRQFTKLTICPTIKLRENVRRITTTSWNPISVTYPLCAEPLKKKKKMDPAIVKAREERRRKKLEKQIRRLEKNARQLKPIDEIEVPLQILDEIKKRQRPQMKLSTEVVEARALLQKQWSMHKREEYINHVAQIDRIMAAQKRALDQLYEESEDLYNEAVMPDLQIIPFLTKGPVATPPIKNYESPDGEYFDVSKKWQD